MANLNIIPYADVEGALNLQKATLREQRDFNTNFHKREEIEAVLPGIQHFPPKEQPWILLSSWLDLIMNSQCLQEEDVHRFELPGKFLVQLIPASKIALQMGRLAEDDAEDLADAFPRVTTRGRDLEELIEKNKYFVRLDTCSLKDALIGEGYIKSTQDLWTRLASSARGIAGIRDLRAHDPLTPISVYLFPWLDTMRTNLEYRVYCPPYMDRISAISQYKWHDRWHHAGAVSNHTAIAERLVKGCKELHEQILAHPSMTDLLRSRGFVFYVAEDPRTQQVRLIELNDFGALSGCGACLFHWIRDAHVLYGLADKVEVRVAV